MIINYKTSGKFVIGLSGLMLTLAMLGTLLYHGPRTCSDATGYLMGAISLKYSHSYRWFATDQQLRQEGFTYEFSCPKNIEDLKEYKRDKQQGYQTHWAPGYPIAIAAVASSLHISTRLALWIVHVLSIGTLLMLFGCLHARQHIPDHPLPMLILVILLCQFLWSLGMLALSEVIFLPLAACQLVFLYNYTRTGKYHLLILSSLLCSFSIFTRYNGLYQIPANIAIIFIYQRRFTFSLCLRDAVLHSTISTFSFIAWQIRNYIMTGAIRGGRIAPAHFTKGLFELMQLPAEICLPIPPELLTRLPAPLVFCLQFISLAAVALLLAYAIKHAFIYRNNPLTSVPLISTCSFLLFLIFTRLSTGEPYPLNFRTFLPAIVSLGVICAVTNDHLRTEKPHLHRALAFFFLLAFLWNAAYCILFLLKQCLCAFHYH